MSKVCGSVVTKCHQVSGVWLNFDRKPLRMYVNKAYNNMFVGVFALSFSMYVGGSYL